MTYENRQFVLGLAVLLTGMLAYAIRSDHQAHAALIGTLIFLAIWWAISFIQMLIEDLDRWLDALVEDSSYSITR